MTRIKLNPRIKAYLLWNAKLQQVECHDYRIADRVRLKSMVPSIRSKELRPRKTWVCASGTLRARMDQARVYLLGIDYRRAYGTYTPEQVLAQIVSNLRNYHRLNQAETKAVMRGVFDSKSKVKWSNEALELAWELVEGFTPSLGLIDPDAISKRHSEELEDRLVDVVAFTRSGGRVAIQDLINLFREWNPDFEVNEIAFGRAFSAITGIRSKPSKGIRYFSGLHLPSALELKDPRHSCGEWVDPGTILATMRAA